jgi:hypothetical protein
MRGEGFKWAFCFQEVFWQTKQTGKIMCQSLCYLCHGQLSTAYKPSFYVHTLKSAHMKKSWLVVFSVAKLLDWEWKQPLLGGLSYFKPIISQFHASKKLEESVIIRWVLEGRETFRIQHSSSTYSNDKGNHRSTTTRLFSGFILRGYGFKPFITYSHNFFLLCTYVIMYVCLCHLLN